MMNILLTEGQIKKVIIENIDNIPNIKSAELFDLKYGTDISMKYDFSPYTEDELWRISLECTLNDDCDKYKKILDEFLPKIFNYVDVTNLPYMKKHYILIGMISGYNVSDIIWFTINGVTFKNNLEQHELIKELPKDVENDIRWVLSPDTIKKIRNRFL